MRMRCLLIICYPLSTSTCLPFKLFKTECVSCIDSADGNGVDSQYVQLTQLTL
jgi:hypothetical protein